MKRVLYWIATNIAVVIVLSLALKLIMPFLPPELQTRNTGFAIYAALLGFGGSIISLLMSKGMAKRASGVQVITQPRNATERWLIDTVSNQAKQAGIGMPEVGIFAAAQMNAFATGANKNNALVAVSTGLLDNMTKQEVEAVLGHEVAHVANGDMITLTLIQGVVNTFVLILARALGLVLSRDGRGAGYVIGFLVGQAIFGFLASFIVSYFSRRREFRADIGGAKYSSTQNMIAALERLQSGKSADLPSQLAAFGINGNFHKLLSTHPPLQDRINALKSAH